MHTEEEARQIWCPQYRQTPGVDEYGVDNRPLEYRKPDPDKGSVPTGRFHPDCCCIASRCMWWRWESERSREKCFHSHGPTPDPDVWERVSPPGAIGVWPTYRRITCRGYCGHAGKPD